MGEFATGVATGVATDAISGFIGGISDFWDRVLDSERADKYMGYIFKKKASDLGSWSRDIYETYGTSDTLVKKSMAMYGQIFNDYGLTSEESARMSGEMAELGAMISQKTGYMEESVYEMIAQALSGQEGALHTLGISMNEEDLQKFVQNQGSSVDYSAMEPTDKIKQQVSYLIHEGNNFRNENWISSTEDVDKLLGKIGNKYIQAFWNTEEIYKSSKYLTDELDKLEKLENEQGLGEKDIERRDALYRNLVGLLPGLQGIIDVENGIIPDKVETVQGEVEAWHKGAMQELHDKSILEMGDVTDWIVDSAWDRQIEKELFDYLIQKRKTEELDPLETRITEELARLGSDESAFEEGFFDKRAIGMPDDGTGKYDVYNQLVEEYNIKAKDILDKAFLANGEDWGIDVKKENSEHAKHNFENWEEFIGIFTGAYPNSTTPEETTQTHEEVAGAFTSQAEALEEAGEQMDAYADSQERVIENAPKVEEALAQGNGTEQQEGAAGTSEITESLSESWQTVIDNVSAVVAQFDMYEQAKTNGEHTMQGLLDGLSSKGPELAAQIVAFNSGLSQLGQVTLGVPTLPSSFSTSKNAHGLAYVPYDDYPAWLHRGEAVLSRNAAEGYRAGLQKPGTMPDAPQLAQAIAQAMSGVTVQMDGQTVGRLVLPTVSSGIARDTRRWGING